MGKKDVADCGKVSVTLKTLMVRRLQKYQQEKQQRTLKHYVHIGMKIVNYAYLSFIPSLATEEDGEADTQCNKENQQRT